MQALAGAGLWTLGAGAAAQASGRTGIDQALRALVVGAPLAGLSVRFSVGSQLVYSGQFGHRHWDGARGRNPVQADTLFRIASVSKLVVALAAARLHQAGRMDLDAPLQIGGQPVRNPAHPEQGVSARHLLTHTSGLRDRDETPPLGAQALLALLAEPGTWSPDAPGRYFSYCNLAFAVLGSAMEAATGQRFDHLMADALFKPLGLQPQFDPSALTRTQRQALATCYRWKPGHGQGGQERPGQWQAQADDWREPPTAARAGPGYRSGFNASPFGPQGALRASLMDLDTVAACLQRGGDALFSPATMAELLRVHWTWTPDKPNGDTESGIFRQWGLGLQRFTGHSGAAQGDALLAHGGPLAWGHLGEAYGLVSGLLFSPDRPAQPGWRLVYAINGTPGNADQEHGHYSAFTPWEETLLTAVLGPRFTATT